jgi:hypothetical protein
MPTRRQVQGTVGRDGLFYLVGGWMPGYTGVVERYNPVTDSWLSYAPLNQARNNMGVVTGRSGRIYAIGGDGPALVGRPVNTVEYALIEVPNPSPYITAQPKSLIMSAGGTATFSVVAGGASSIRYQWQFNGADLPGETNSTLVISSVTTANLGAYKVVVFNSAGSVTSEPAFLTFPDLAHGLVAHYPFDGSANDASGNGNHAAVMGAVLSSDRAGRIRSAYRFDGVDDYAVASVAQSPLGNTPRTIVAWVKPEDARLVRGVVQQGNGDCTGRMFGIVTAFEGLSFWGGCQDIASGLSVPINKWSFIAISYDGSRIQMRSNERSESYAIGGLNTSPGRLFIGAETVNDGASFRSFFRGWLDDVRIYNRVLTEAELDVLYSMLPRVPEILEPPASLATLAGADVALGVTADGTPPLSYQWQQNGANLPGETNSTLNLFDVGANEAGAYKVVVSNTGGTTTSEAAILTVAPVLTLPVALDTSILYWRSGGPRAWFPQNTISHDGAHSAQSGGAAHSQNSWIETTVAGPGTLTFWWRVSSEPGFDTCRFFVTETLQVSISGEVDWHQQRINIPAGLQTLRWVYSKDGSSSVGQDRAWLDQVVYTPDPGIDQPFHVVAKRRFPDGRFKLSFFGPTDRRYLIERSSDLVDWTPVATHTNAIGTFDIVDAEAVGAPHRFYRAVEAP